jgi:hypothetical protein
MLRIILLLLPAVAGIVVILAKPEGFVSWVNDASAGWDRRYVAAKAREGLLNGVWRALIWGFHKLHQWTEGIDDDATRAGVRTASFFYVGALTLSVIATAIYLVIIVVLIVVGLWILAAVLGGESNRAEDSYERVMPTRARRGTSRQRRDWMGHDYEEHLDGEGRPAGRSDVSTDWLGNTHVERRDADGEVVETSHHQKDWLGNDFVEHRGADGEATGESRDRKDWLGNDYVEHTDADNQEAGRSTQRRDWLGNSYTEHEPKD